MGDPITISGDLRGAILNIKSTLENVSQSISATPNADARTKEELVRLFDQLKMELQNVPPARVEQAEAVAESAKALVEASTREQPNKTTVKITAEGLKAAAENIATIMPTVLVIASAIVRTVSQFVGIPTP